MKVIQVTERYPPAVGGVETHVFRLSQELRKLGVDVEILTTDLHSTLPLVRFQNSEKTVGGAPVVRVRGYPFLPLPQGLGVISPGMLRYLKAADIVHVHGYGHFPTYLAQYCRISRLPVVATTHSDAGRPSIGKSIFDAVVPPLSIKLARRVIAISEHEKRVLIERGVSPDKISVIPNGVDVEMLSSGDLQKDSEGAKRLMYAGRIDDDQKGIDLLIEAFARLAQSTPGLELVLMGPDWNGSTTRLKKLASKIDVGKKVHFTDYLKREEYLQNLRSADLFVLPSRFEPFGIVLLEAMSAGVPIVASNTGAIPEILGGGRFGLLFQSGNVSSLAHAIEAALFDKEGSSTRARDARESLKRFAWPKIASETLRIYEDVLGRPVSRF